MAKHAAHYPAHHPDESIYNDAHSFLSPSNILKVLHFLFTLLPPPFSPSSSPNFALHKYNLPPDASVPIQHFNFCSSSSSSQRSSPEATMHGDNTEVPIHYPQTPTNQSKPIRRHHTARYYVQRVQDSLTTRVSKVFCSIFLSLLAIVGLIAFILWLSLRPHRPRFHIHDFSVPGLGQESGFENAEIKFFVTARNSNQHIEIYYEAMDGTVYYRDQNIGTTPLLFPFSQEPKNTTEVNGVLSGATLTVTSQRWAEFLNDRAQGSVVFRVELTSTIKFKVNSWQSKRHRMHANCDVGVGPDGGILNTYKDKRCPVYFS